MCIGDGAKPVPSEAAAAGIGTSLGLLVAGALTDLVSWRAAFLVNIPISAVMVFAARAVLVELTDAGREQLRAVRADRAAALQARLDRLDDDARAALEAALPALDQLLT